MSENVNGLTILRFIPFPRSMKIKGVGIFHLKNLIPIDTAVVRLATIAAVN